MAIYRSHNSHGAQDSFTGWGLQYRKFASNHCVLKHSFEQLLTSLICTDFRSKSLPSNNLFQSRYFGYNPKLQIINHDINNSNKINICIDKYKKIYRFGRPEMYIRNS